MNRIRAVMVAAFAALAFDAAAADVGRTKAPEGGGQKLDKQADELLRQMSDYMSGLKSFKVSASVVDEAVTTDGQRIQFLAEQNISVKRPDKLRTDRTGSVADTVFRYDGSQFAVYGKKTGYYATAAAPSNLDEAVAAARAKYGIDAPGADLFLGKPYDALMEGVTQSAYLGVEPIAGMQCHHLAFRGAETDFQLWVQDGAQPLPCRYSITSKKDPEKPEFSVALSQWKPNAVLGDDVFAFKPPAGSKKIQLKSQEATK